MIYKILFVIMICIIGDMSFAETFDLLSTNEQIKVKFIPQNEKQANIVIENNTDKPVSIRLPRSFAAVPVLAQAVGAGFNNGGIQPFNNGVGFNNGGIQQPQRVAGGFASTNEIHIKGNGKKTIQVNTLCVDYGAPIPNPRITYELVNIDFVSSDSRLYSVIDMMTELTIDQKSAQILAWHINSKISIDSLVKTGEISIDQAQLVNSYVSQL